MENFEKETEEINRIKKDNKQYITHEEAKQRFYSGFDVWFDLEQEQ